MAAALPDPGWPRGNCPILLLATTVHRSFHHHRLLPGLRPCSTQRKDVLFNPDSPRLLRTLRRGVRCFSGDRFSMSVALGISWRKDLGDRGHLTKRKSMYVCRESM